MGFNPFKKVKKAVGKVFSGITKGLDKITGGKFSKIMGNKWVRGALMAVAVVTGGIAIANGVMAAGQAGIGAAAKSFAANMSMQTGKTLVSSLIQGGKQFITGVAKGLANPLKSDAGQALSGMFESGVSNLTGTPATGTDQLSEAMSGSIGDGGSAAQSALDVGGVSKPVSLAGNPAAIQSGNPLVSPDFTNTFGTSADSLMKSSGSYDPSTWAGADANLFTTADNVAGGSGGLGSHLMDAASKTTEMAPDLLSRLGKGVTDYAASPAGIYQVGSALQGWASGQALQEQWDRMDEEQKKVYRSWTDGSFQAPKLSWNPARQPATPTA